MILFWQLANSTFSMIGLFSTQPENGATVSATLQYPNGTPVPGFINVPGTYVPGTSGNYTFPAPATITAPAGAYVVVVSCTTPGGLKRTWTLDALIVASGGSN